MSATPEQIAAALYARAQTVPGLVTVSRRLRAWNEVDSVEQPALFQASEDGDVPAPPVTAGGRSAAGVTRPVLRYAWWIYLHESRLAADVLLDTAMNDALAACFAALKPPTGSMAQTLGGLVADCRIAGAIGRDGGVLGEQGVLSVPIEIQCFPF